MNKWKALLPVVTAFAEGKVIQERYDGGGWRDIPPWSTLAFSLDAENYRVKPEPREFYINIYDDGCKYLHATSTAAAQAFSSRSCYAGTTIKVREVAE